LTKNKLGNIFGRFFTNSSGHPEIKTRRGQAAQASAGKARRIFGLLANVRFTHFLKNVQK
jgi:hypothetical protein